MISYECPIVFVLDNILLIIAIVSVNDKLSMKLTMIRHESVISSHSHYKSVIYSRILLGAHLYTRQNKQKTDYNTNFS